MKKLLLFIAILISGMGLFAQNIGDKTIIDYEGYSLRFTVTSIEPAECDVVCSTKPTTSIGITIPSSVIIEGTEFSVTSIGDWAFHDCYYLTSIEIPNSVTSIGNDAFEACFNLTSVEIPNTVSYIGYYAFYSCKNLTSIEIPHSVTFIGDYAFLGCFYLTSITVEEGNPVYDSRNNCNAIIETETNTLIQGCQNTVIPNTVISIFEWAFSGCRNLTSIEIPNSVSYIGDEVFSHCSNLTSIYCYAESVPETGSSAFNNCPSDMVIYVPAQSVGAYKAASPWNEYTILPLETETVVCDVPQNLKVVVTKDDSNYNKKYKITLTWDAVEGAEGYAVYIATQQYPEGMWMGDVTTTEFVIGVDVECELYFFVKTICNGDLGIVSEPSESVLCVVLAETEFDVVAATNIENAGIVLGTGTYSQGDTVTLTATANEGYKFINWTENGEVVSEEAEYSFEITKDRNLVANFELLSYNVTASVNPENAGVVTGAGTYNHGEEVTLTATANEGYKFINWTENGEVVSEEAEYSFEITEDRNLVANFELLSYNVTASVNPENAGVVNGAGTYNHGEEVTLTATANEGYKFINWTENGEVVSEEAECSFEVTKDRNLVANFEEIEDPENPGGNEPEQPGDDEKTCVVTAVANPEEGGSVSGAGTYKKDMTVTLKATAKSGYQFLNWTENDVIVSTENEYSFIVTKDINLVANFEKTTCNVTVVVNPEEAGTVTGAGTYVKNMSVTLVATANPGYKFVNWTENGTIVSTEREYSFVVSLDTDLVANFISTEGVEELTSSFNIYPNPVSDKLYIETQTQTVEIYDVYGRQQSMVNGQQSTVIDVSNLNSGVYFVKVVTKEGEVVKRFIKK